MAILQAYVDESEQKSDNPPNGWPPLNVLSYVGCVATSKSWETFSDEWQACLDTPPRIAYLKMSEAMARQREFKGWSKTECYNKIGDLYGIMQKYISGGACFVLNLNDFRKLSKHFPSPRMRNHFYYATYGIMHNLMKNSNALGIDGPIDFVFDVNTMSKHVIPAWE